jgi:hypothetical protein
MDNFLKQSRILEYVLVIGLAIVFMAVLLVLLGSNARAADIYVDDDNAGGPWDGSMANPYQNITSGIANSNPTDNIYVWDGSYNENITIDKSLQLIGNSSATTTIDGFGTFNNIINITAEGVEVTGFNITESGLWYGIWVNVGGFNIHDNVFNTQDYAIYMDISRMFSISTVIGDIIVDSNEVIGTGGFYFYINYEKPITGSNLVFGQTVISNNKLYNTDTGIILYRYKMRDLSGGSVTWGDITVNDNFVNCFSDNGIFFWGWIVNMTDVDISLGNIDILGNNITSSSTGIQIVAWDTIDFFGTTVATIGDTHINNNTISSQYYNGITLYSSYLFFLYDSASVTTGDFFIYSNNITTAGPIGQEGICIFIIGVGQYMYNDSSVDFGNMYIDSNIVNSTKNGILIEIEDSGSDMHDNAIANIGDISVTNNNLTSTKNGIHFKMLNVGVGMDGNSSATFGNFIIDGNDIFSNENGTYVDWFQIGNNMKGQASLIMGDFEIGPNIINSTKDGIHLDIQNIGYNMEGDTTVQMGALNIIYNTIDANRGINITRIQYLGYFMFGGSSFTWGGLYVDENIINVMENGIHQYDVWPPSNIMGHWGERLNDSASFEMGLPETMASFWNGSDIGVTT